ncbi:MAG TPA: efflux RND transporter periplasmic adaptor subunit [Opitutaceae bacterium]|nr:efflux RND transporter periplasmic adaptor subunit [Opitutaceae bacterium]
MSQSAPTPATRTASSRPLPAPRKKSRKLLYIIIGVVLVVGLAVAAAMKNKGREEIVAVTTDKAVTKTITQLVSATGKIQPEKEVKISPEVAGEIIYMPLKEGASVHKGDLLLKIKPDYYKSVVEQQEAALASAKAESIDAKSRLQKAEEDFKRSQDLFNRKLISDSDYTTAKSAYEVAVANEDNMLAQIRRAEGLLKQARDQLEKCTIFAPMDGTISSRTSEEGERVVAQGQFTGTEVMRVADLTNMEVRANVNENDVVNVKIGDVTRISIDAYPNRKFTGVVTQIASTAKTSGANTQEEVTNFEVRVKIQDAGVPLRPGMSANVDVETQTVHDVVAIPIQSVTVRSKVDNKTVEQLAMETEAKKSEGKGEGAATAINEKKQRDAEKAARDSLQRVVFVREGDHVKQVPVETGIADNTHIEIKSGVKAGDEVVTGNFSVITRKLKDGMKVKTDMPKPGAKKS